MKRPWRGFSTVFWRGREAKGTSVFSLPVRWRRVVVAGSDYQARPLCFPLPPPVGLDLFVASAITKVPIERVMIASLPYLYALLVTLVILTIFPWFITVLPSMLR